MLRIRRVQTGTRCNYKFVSKGANQQYDIIGSGNDLELNGR